MRKKWAAIALVPVILSSCSMSYKQPASMEETVPELVFTGASFSRYKNGNLEVNFTSEKMEQYKTSEKVFARNINFNMYDKEGKPTSSGECALLAADILNDSYMMLGGLTIQNVEKKLTITAENLLWNSKTEQIVGTKNDIVSIKKDSTEMSGRGFSASAISGKFSFTNSVAGTSTDTEDNGE